MRSNWRTRKKTHTRRVVPPYRPGLTLFCKYVNRLCSNLVLASILSYPITNGQPKHTADILNAFLMINFDRISCIVSALGRGSHVYYVSLPLQAEMSCECTWPHGPEGAVSNVSFTWSAEKYFMIYK